MSLLSRTKGISYEQRIARDLRKVMPKATIHRSSQADRPYGGDVVVTGDAPALARRMWLECQDSRHPTPLDKLAQAERDTDGEVGWLPVVVWHLMGSRSVHVTMRYGTWLVIAENAVHDAKHPGIPVTIDWSQFLHVLKALVPKEAA